MPEETKTYPEVIHFMDDKLQAKTPTVAEVIAALQEMPQDALFGTWHYHFLPCRHVSRQQTQITDTVVNEDGSESWAERTVEVVLV